MLKPKPTMLIHVDGLYAENRTPYIGRITSLTPNSNHNLLWTDVSDYDSFGFERLLIYVF